VAKKIWLVLRFTPTAKYLYIKTAMEKIKRNRTKNEFLRLRIDRVEKGRLDKLCSITRRQKSDIIRESLFDYFKSKYPECLVID